MPTPIWTYADYITYLVNDGATYRQRLALHIQEVSEVLEGRLNVGADGYDPTPLIEYRKQLRAELAEAARDSSGGVAADSPRATSAFVRGRAI